MVEKLLVENKNIVVPGEVLAEGMNFLPGKRAFREKEKICASILGLVNINGRVISVIPLSGAYMPNKDDVVIGQIEDVGFSGWHVNIFCPYPADLNVAEATRKYLDTNKTELTRFLDIGEYIFAKVIKVSSSKFVILTMKDRPYRKLKEGTIIKICSTKIPRLIGKKGSMVNMLKQSSGCEILIGQNGLVWISGDPEKEQMVVRAISKIEEEAHREGLTDRIKTMLGGENGKKRTARETNS
ncbi:MAG: KH domain-containing protein [Candidatus Woesearchaeota archaeon]|nr:MAG: KH domain-containing protein [Candidatus Woesearchaeota archaeon]